MSQKTLENKVELILHKFYKEKRVVQGKRIKNDEIIHVYIEEFFMKFDTVIRSLSEVKNERV